MFMTEFKSNWENHTEIMEVKKLKLCDTM